MNIIKFLSELAETSLSLYLFSDLFTKKFLKLIEIPQTILTNLYAALTSNSTKEQNPYRLIF